MRKYEIVNAKTQQFISYAYAHGAQQALILFSNHNARRYSYYDIAAREIAS